MNEKYKEFLKNGLVKKSELIQMNNTKGFLIWRYKFYNEILFVSSDNQTELILFSSFDNDDTEKEFLEIIKKYNN